MLEINYLTINQTSFGELEKGATFIVKERTNPLLKVAIGAVDMVSGESVNLQSDCLVEPIKIKATAVSIVPKDPYMIFNLTRTLDDKGKVAIPKEIREKIHAMTGDKFGISLNKEGNIVLTKITY